LRTGHETLLRLVPTQGKQNFLAFGRGSQGGFPDELPIRLKKNRYEELLRPGYSFEHQEGLHFQAMICAVHFQLRLLVRRIWDNGRLRQLPFCRLPQPPKISPIAMRNCHY
jgi:hypothetical protein